MKGLDGMSFSSPNHSVYRDEVNYRQLYNTSTLMRYGGKDVPNCP